MVHRFKAKAVIFMTAADPWSIMPLLSSSVPCVCMCYSEEHRKWFMKAAESVALRSFLDCQSKLYKAEVAKVLKDLPLSEGPHPPPGASLCKNRFKLFLNVSVDFD